MAVTGITYIWPPKLPQRASVEMFIKYTSGAGEVATSVKIGGVSCSITAASGSYGWVRVKTPSRPSGVPETLALEVTTTGAPFTLSNAVEYVATGDVRSRRWLTTGPASNYTWPPMPAGERAAGTPAATASGAISSTNMLVPITRNDQIGGVNSGGASPLMSISQSAVGFVAGYSSVPAYDVRSVDAGTWKVRLAIRRVTTGATPPIYFDKLAVYWYRPSTDSVVGYVYDNTNDGTTLAAGATYGGSYYSYPYSFSGSAVSGIQDGDVLRWEMWARTGTGTGTAQAYASLAGSVETTDVAGDTVSTPVAAYIEAPRDFWAPPPTATGVTPSGFSPGDTITIPGYGFTGTTPTVTVGGIPATDVTVVDDNTITATVPGGIPTGSVDVVVTFPGGSTTLPGVSNTLDYNSLETLAYKTASLHTDGTFLWDLASLRRGAWGTTIGAHPAGATFMDTASALRVALPQSRFDVPLYVKLVPFNVYGGGRPELADVPAYAVTVPLQGSVAPTTATLTVLVSPPAPATNQWREASTDNLHGRLARVQWTFTAPTTTKIAPHRGFEVVVFTGTDPTDTSKYLRTIETVDTIRDAVIGVSNATASPITIRAAVRALYADGLKSPWRTTGSDTLPENTSPVQQASADAANALTLAGSNTKVFFQTSAPTSGMTNGDIWYDTTTYVDSDGTTKKRYTPYRYNVSVWEPYDKALIIASEIAAGAIVADKIAANAVDVSKLTVGAISENLFPNATSEIDPPAGLFPTPPSPWGAGYNSAFAEWAWRKNVGGAAPSGNWVRSATATGSTLLCSVDVPCSPGASMYIEAVACVLAGATGYAGVTIQFLNTSGTDLAGGTLFNQTNSTIYTKVSCSGTAPAGTVKARMSLYVSGNTTAFWDGIVARRMVGGELVVNGSITADKIAGNQFKTPNYAFTGTEGGSDEVATAGAKMQNAPGGTALLVAPGNLRVGKMNFSRMFSVGVIEINATANTVTLRAGLNLSVGGWTTRSGIDCISISCPGIPGDTPIRAVTFGINKAGALSGQRHPAIIEELYDTSGGYIAYVAFDSGSGWHTSAMPNTTLYVLAMQPDR